MLDANLTKQNFITLFDSVELKKYIWDSSDYIGLSIIKDYPESIKKFYPAKNELGKMDSTTVIKIGFDNLALKGDTTRIPLRVSINKSSHYIIALEQSNSQSAERLKPTEAEENLSKNSVQPHGLIESERFQYNADSNTMYDTVKYCCLSPYQLIDYIFELHLKTLNDKIFRTKMFLLIKIPELLNFVIKLFEQSLFVFGKKLKKNNVFEGILGPYTRNALVHSELIGKSVKIFGTDFDISEHSAKIAVLGVATVYLVDYYFSFDIFGIKKLIVDSSKNPVFIVTVMSAYLFFIDKIPSVLFIVINFLIRLKVKISMSTVSIGK